MNSHTLESHRDNSLHSNFENRINNILSPIYSFIHKQYASAVGLFIATILSMVIINIGPFHYLENIGNIKIGFHYSELYYSMSIKDWINHGLMTIFFFFIGLEVKREIIAGKLSDIKELSLIIFSSLGGMVAPAIIYIVINYNVGINGWAIPMVTDTAFSIGILAIFTRLLSVEAIIFFIALVIFDDIGSMIILAFASEHMSYMPMLKGVLVILLLVVLNHSGVRSRLMFSILGLILWHYFNVSGLHSSITGLILAFTIPVKSCINDRNFIHFIRNVLFKLEKNKDSNNQFAFTHEISTIVNSYSSPSQQWEHDLTGLVCTCILPLFAFFNAGVLLSGCNISQAFVSPSTTGIILGLVIGKPLGIISFCFFAKWLRIGKIPRGVTFQEIIGIGLLSGIGFTMSMYNAEFVFNNNPQKIISAKIGVLIASLISLILGLSWLFYIKTRSAFIKENNAENPAGVILTT